jgi:hypothetical protein
MVRPYLAELDAAAEEDFIRWAQVEVASVEGVGKNSVRCAVRVGCAFAVCVWGGGGGLMGDGDGLVGWLVDWLVGWLVDWLMGYGTSHSQPILPPTH